VVARGIMFSGCPSMRLSVRLSICPSVAQSLGARYLTGVSTDLYQTWHGNSLWRVDELIRYSRSLGQRSRSYGVIYENHVCEIYREGFDGSLPNFTWLLLWRVDELIRYSRSWGQRSRSYGAVLKNFVCTLSHEGFDWSSPNLTWLLPMKSRWTD